MSDVSISKGGKGDGSGTGLKGADADSYPDARLLPADTVGKQRSYKYENAGWFREISGRQVFRQQGSSTAMPESSGKSACGNSSDKNSKGSSKNSKSKNSKSSEWIRIPAAGISRQSLMRSRRRPLWRMTGAGWQHQESAGESGSGCSDL